MRWTEVIHTSVSRHWDSCQNRLPFILLPAQILCFQAFLEVCHEFKSPQNFIIIFPFLLACREEATGLCKWSWQRCLTTGRKPCWEDRVYPSTLCAAQTWGDLRSPAGEPALVSFCSHVTMSASSSSYWLSSKLSRNEPPDTFTAHHRQA